MKSIKEYRQKKKHLFPPKINESCERKCLQFDLYKVNEECTLLNYSFKCHEKLSSHKWIALHQIF